MKRVLVVDDCEGVSRNIVDILKRKGFYADEAHNGVDGYPMAQEDCYDLILTDIEMPLMDGIEMVRKIREAGNNTKIIFCTAYPKGEYAEAAEKYDCEVIVKPLDLERIMEVLK